MTPLFKKLNLSTQTQIHVLNAPASFESELQGVAPVLVKRKAIGLVHFALAFVMTQAELDAASSQLTQAAGGDAVLWLAYPKGTSKKYKCEFNRDSGWAVLGAAGFEPVRQVAIDEDWSALRFRRAEFIKTITRHPAGAISEVGQQRAKVTAAASAKTARTARTARTAKTVKTTKTTKAPAAAKKPRAT
jgi:hypothetical protein